MKKLLLLLLLLPCFAMAQTFKPDENFQSTYLDQPAYLIDTVVSTTFSKQQLYSNALSYAVTRFKDSRNVVEMKDAELGEIVLKGNVSRSFFKYLNGKKGKKDSIVMESILLFKCRIYVKDNKFKVVLSSLQTPFSALIPDGYMTIRINEANERAEDRYAREQAVSLIKDIAFQINKKPENDF